MSGPLIDLSGGGPDFGRIHIGDFNAIEDAFRILWFSLLGLNAQAGAAVTVLEQMLKGKTYTFNPGANAADWDIGRVLVVNSTSSSAFLWSGIRNGTDGRVIALIVTGTGTVTVQHNNASSAAGNRFSLAAGADKAVATGKGMLLTYLTTNNFWNELSPA